MLATGTASGAWAARQLGGAELAAPHLVMFEVANVLRRLERSKAITGDAAAQAHHDLLDLPIDLWPYETLAARSWQLRGNLSSYDAAYVALAAELDATLVTLDRRLAAAPGLPCAVAVPT
jgi:predicted nucleic acid-binding protein